MTVKELINKYCFDFEKGVDKLHLIILDYGEYEINNLNLIPIEYEQCILEYYVCSIRTAKCHKEYVFILEIKPKEKLTLQDFNLEIVQKFALKAQKDAQNLIKY